MFDFIVEGCTSCSKTGAMDVLYYAPEVHKHLMRLSRKEKTGPCHMHGCVRWYGCSPAESDGCSHSHTGCRVHQLRVQWMSHIHIRCRLLVFNSLHIYILSINFYISSHCNGGSEKCKTTCCPLI
jgi:hypothetical protein